MVMQEMQELIDADLAAATRAVQDTAAELARWTRTDVSDFTAFRRAWIRDLGRLAREHHDDWTISAYAVQTIRQLRGQLPIH